METVYEQSVEKIRDDYWLTLAGLALVVVISLIGLYIVGLAPNAAAHAAFHDIRHAAGFPCH